MRRHTSRVRSRILTALLMLLPVLVLVSTGNAAVGWPQELSNIYAQEVVTHPDGFVSAFSCSSGGDPNQNLAAQTFDANGTATNAVVGRDTFQFCEGWQGAVGRGGFSYGAKYSTTGRVDIVAYSGNVQRWSRQLTGCTGQWGMPAGMTIGADGYLYVVAYAGGCTTPYYLWGFNVTTGAVKFKKAIGSAEATDGSDDRYLAAYANGLVVRLGKTHFRHYSYAGVEDTAKRYTLTLSTGEFISSWATNMQGAVFVAIDHVQWDRPEPCTQAQILKRVVRRTLTGVNYTYNTASQCMRTQKIQVTPDGGAVFARDMSNSMNEPYDPAYALVFLKPNGFVVDKAVAVTDGHYVDVYGPSQALVDTAGSILYTRHIKEEGGDRDRVIEVFLFDANGSQRAVFSTKIYSIDRQWDDQWSTDGGVGIANGFVYLVLCRSSSCSSTSPQQLYKIPFAEVGFDYPRGALLGVQAPTVTTLNYAALGDSFPSGEGVEPFDPATDTAGPPENRCHRSEKAYAKLLDPDPAVPLRLESFVACSGAMTGQITGTWPEQDGKNLNEAAQVEALNADTDVVTITIGGNDVGFDDFARACTFARCDDAPKDAILAKIRQELPGELSSAYSAIQNRLATLGSNAKVYVLGYPNLVKPGGEPLHAPLQCSQFTDLERNAVLEVIAELNRVIGEKVTEAGSRFEFVPATAPGSPFAGNELCTETPYFNNAITDGNEEYSYHPNQHGQNAYATLLKEAMDN